MLLLDFLKENKIIYILLPPTIEINKASTFFKKEFNLNNLNIINYDMFLKKNFIPDNLYIVLLEWHNIIVKKIDNLLFFKEIEMNIKYDFKFIKIKGNEKKIDYLLHLIEISKDIYHSLISNKEIKNEDILKLGEKIDINKHVKRKTLYINNFNAVCRTLHFFSYNNILTKINEFFKIISEKNINLTFIFYINMAKDNYYVDIIKEKIDNIFNNYFKMVSNRNIIYDEKLDSLIIENL